MPLPAFSPPEQSPAQALVGALVGQFGIEGARAALAAFLDEDLSVVEAASLAYDWRIWGRPKQQPPRGRRWRRWGYLTGRGFGKTIALSHHVHDAVATRGRAFLGCLLAQDEQSAVDIQVQGPSGLIATAPPWARPEWEASGLRLVWPNGARAYVRTPEVPGKIRGLEYDLTWASELQSWPVATREEAFANVLLSTRLGDARVLWDSTPKKRHPILRELLSDAERDPNTNIVVRGTTHENAANLAVDYVADLQRKYGGTLRGREELLGEMLPESENAIVHDEWIAKARRASPERFARRVIACDPAITKSKGSDTTGIVDVGLAEGQAYVLGDYSGRHAVGAWADLVIDRYLAGGCDLVVAETNKGGDLIAQNIRAAAAPRGLRVVVIAKDGRPPGRAPGTIVVREVFARGAKEDRAGPVATAYERGRISHVFGASLTSLEDTLTTWEPTAGADSPGDLDALVHGCVEVLGLNNDKVPAATAGDLVALVRAQKSAARPAPPSPTAAAALLALSAHLRGAGGRRAGTI